MAQRSVRIRTEFPGVVSSLGPGIGGTAPLAITDADEDLGARRAFPHLKRPISQISVPSGTVEEGRALAYNTSNESQEGPINTTVLVHARTVDDLNALEKGQFTFFDHFDKSGRNDGRPITISYLNGYLGSMEGITAFGNDTTSDRIAQQFIPAGMQTNQHVAEDGRFVHMAITRGRITGDGMTDMLPAVGRQTNVTQHLYLMCVRCKIRDELIQARADGGVDPDAPKHYWQFVPYAAENPSQPRAPPMDLYDSPLNGWRGHAFHVGTVRHVSDMVRPSHYGYYTGLAARSFFPNSTDKSMYVDFLRQIPRTTYSLDLSLPL